MFGNIYKNKKVLVTGHTGFKGSWLTLWLLNMEAKVVGVSIDIPTDPSLFNILGLNERITDYREDVRNLEALKKIVSTEKPDFIFHLAAQPVVSLSYTDPINTISTNVLGTACVLESIKRLDNFCVCVMITSDKCYENVEWEWGYRENDRLGGKDIYSSSKGSAELIIYSYFHSFFKNAENIRLGTVRAGNVIGGGDWTVDRIVPDTMKAWSAGQSVEIRSPNATRPWQHVLEPLSGYLDLGARLYLDRNLHGESFNFGPNAISNHAVVDLLEGLYKYWKKEESFLPFKIVDNVPFHEAKLLKLSCEKALFYLKWLPNLNYEELVKMTSLWYKEFYSGNEDMLSFTNEQLNHYIHLAVEKNLKWTQ